MTGYTRRFIQVSKAWYAKTAMSAGELERFDLSVEDSETAMGEFSVFWATNSPSKSSELRVLDDGWQAFSHCQDLVARVAAENGEKLTPAKLKAHLMACGFQDATPFTKEPSSSVLTPVQQAHVDVVFPECREAMIDYLSRGVDVIVRRQNDCGDEPPFSVSPTEKLDFWIGCWDSEALAEAAAVALGLRVVAAVKKAG